MGCQEYLFFLESFLNRQANEAAHKNRSHQSNDFKCFDCKFPVYTFIDWMLGQVPETIFVAFFVQVLDSEEIYNINSVICYNNIFI